MLIKKRIQFNLVYLYIEQVLNSQHFMLSHFTEQNVCSIKLYKLI